MSDPVMPPAPHKVLLIKPSALGDVVTALPVLRGLRRSFPDATIDWLVSDACASILQDDTDIDQIVLFERKRLGRAWFSPGATKALLKFRRQLSRARYDWVIDLQGLARSGIFAKWTRADVRAGFADAREGAPLSYTHPIDVVAEHTVDRNIALARAMGVDARSDDLHLHLADETRQKADTLLAQSGLETGRFLAVVPPTRWTTKHYPLRHWRRVVAELVRFMPVALLGSPSQAERSLCAAIADRQRPGVVDLAGRTDLPTLAGVIAASAGVLCCDSAAKFIAAAVGTDCVVLIGPTQSERTGPYGRGRSLVADIPCQGCLKKRCPHVTCMDAIAPDRVVHAARAMLQEAAPCP